MKMKTRTTTTTPEPSLEAEGVRRRTLLKSSALLGASALFGGTLLGTGRAFAAESVTMWHGWAGADNTTALNKVIELFRAEVPDVDLQPTAFEWDALFSKWVVSFASGAAPDLVLFHTSEVPEYAGKGLIIPASKPMEDAGIDLTGVPEAAIEASRFDGELYAIPVDSHPLAMYFNSDLVEAAGLDPETPPTTGEEFLEWAKKLTVKADNGEVAQYGVDLHLTSPQTRWLWFSLLHQFGGGFFGDDGLSAVDSEASRQALQYMVDLVQVHGVANPSIGDGIGSHFATGRVATRCVGPWEVNLRLSQDMRFGTAQLPVIGSKPAAWANSHCMSFSANKPEAKIEAAAKFAGWFFNNFAIPATTVGIIPLSPAARESEDFTQSAQFPYYQAFIDTLPYAVYEPAIEQYTQIFSFSKPTPLVSNLQSALSGSKSVEDALKDMKEGIDRQLA